MTNGTIKNSLPVEPARLRLRYFLYILFFIIIIIGTVYGIYLSFFKPGSTLVKTKAVTSGVLMSFIPSTIMASPNTEFTVTAVMNTNDKTVSAAELHFAYDQTKLEGESITASDFLPVILTSGTIGTGTASIILGSQPSSPQKGNGIVAILKFKSLSSSPSQIAFTNSTDVRAINETTNVVAETDNATVNETPTTTQTPIPTTPVTPSPTPSPAICPCNKADLNGDGYVTLLDFSIYAACQGKPLSYVLSSGIPCSKADTNNDGVIDQKDYACIQSNFGKQCVPNVSCNSTCYSDSDCVTGYCFQPPIPICPTGLFCSQVMPAKVCRNQNCPSSTDCNCTSLTPTPTPIPTITMPIIIPTVIIVSVTPSPTCNETSCPLIKAKIGRGCTTQDYIRCIRRRRSPTIASASPLLTITPPLKPITGISFLDAILYFLGFGKGNTPSSTSTSSITPTPSTAPQLSDTPAPTLESGSTPTTVPTSVPIPTQITEITNIPYPTSNPPVQIVTNPPGATNIPTMSPLNFARRPTNSTPPISTTRRPITGIAFIDNILHFLGF